MLFDDYYAPNDHPIKPNYSLDEFLQTQFDEENINVFWHVMQRIFIDKASLQLTIESKSKNHYAGQRGLFYILSHVLPDNGREFEMDGDKEYSVLYNTACTYNEEAETFVPLKKVEEKYTLTSHLEITPDTAMATNHFVQMVSKWAREITFRISLLTTWLTKSTGKNYNIFK